MSVAQRLREKQQLSAKTFLNRTEKVFNMVLRHLSHVSSHVRIDWELLKQTASSTYGDCIDQCIDELIFTLTYHGLDVVEHQTINSSGRIMFEFRWKFNETKSELVVKRMFDQIVEMSDNRASRGFSSLKTQFCPYLCLTDYVRSELTQRLGSEELKPVWDGDTLTVSW